MSFRLLAATLIAFATLTSSSAASQVAKVITTTVAYADPNTSARKIMGVSTNQPITGAATTLVITDSVYDRKGTRWLKVMLPGRGHSKGGWINSNYVRIQTNNWAVKVSRKTRHATIVKKGKNIKRFRVVVGTKNTPTPAGRFQIMEVVKQPKDSKLGPWVLATNAYSAVLQEFNGGPGQIGLHGRTGLPDPLGSAASHGCVRFADSAITWMAQNLPTGTTITIS